MFYYREVLYMSPKKHQFLLYVKVCVARINYFYFIIIFYIYKNRIKIQKIHLIF